MADTHTSFQAPIGTRDVLPPESDRWQEVVARFAVHVRRAGYGLVQSPMFEDLGVFQRVGEATDIVTKEMYDFHDKGGRHVALRPEGTASIVRAFNQHRPPVVPWKVWYVGPNFRYEAPQAGRYRQHHQLGVEALGSADPDLDVEVIALQADFYRSLGLTRVELVVNTMGTPADRTAYGERLQAWLRTRVDDLDPADRDKVEANPLRLLDSKRPASIAVTAEAPRSADQLSSEAADHFDRVRSGLDALGIEHRVEPRLVRGLDYYTHTTFEFQALALESAQNAVGGGGRYDGLAEALGGRPAPGVGFGAGIERVLLACDAEQVLDNATPTRDAFVVDVVDGTRARDLVVALRRAGLAVDRAFDGRSMKAQMKAADRSGARVALIIGAEEAEAGEVTVRDLRGAAEQRRLPMSEIIDHLRTHRP